MKKTFYLLIGLSALSLTSCNKPPTACMELSSNAVNIGHELEFTSCSKKAISYEWFIQGPDGAPENSQGWSDPYFKHAFSISGTYTVSLSAYEDFSFSGRSSTVVETFVVN